MAKSSTPGLVWTRDRQRGSAGRPALDLETITGAAIDLLDTDGIDGLSMRRLAASLGATAPTLYWHVRNKEELLDVAFDQVMSELDDPAAKEGEWRVDVRASLDDLRAMALRHQWYSLLYFTRPSIGPQALRFWGGLTEVLHRGGLSGAELDHAFCMLSDHVVGTAAIQVSFDIWLAEDPADINATHHSSALPSALFRPTPATSPTTSPEPIRTPAASKGMSTRSNRCSTASPPGHQHRRALGRAAAASPAGTGRRRPLGGGDRTAKREPPDPGARAQCAPAAASRINRTASGTPPSQAGPWPGNTHVASTPSSRSSDVTA